MLLFCSVFKLKFFCNVKLVNIRYMECMFVTKKFCFFFRLILTAFYSVKYWVSSAYLTIVLQFL